ncbi:MAG: ATP synthase subunit I [Spirochaetales bacterium]|jgi:F1F0 ATPase subunit 2|nr:ATP synthase subunit I [Spirochaetales bacterium]
MSKVVILITAFAAGIGLGAFYFGGLWLTVQRLSKVRRPALLSMCSLFGRLGITVFGFYLIMDGHWERMIVCMIGFLVMRGILVRHWGPNAYNS